MNKRILFVATIYETYPMIVPSLLNMTYQNWNLALIHDGPAKKFDYTKFFQCHSDPRIACIFTGERLQNFGHPNKKKILEVVRDGPLGSDNDFIVITNSDNYYVPGFCESMLTGFSRPSTLAVYCDKMAHNYTHWGIIDGRLERGQIDIGQLMFKIKPAVELGWGDSVDHSADWFYIERFIQKHGVSSFNCINGCLFVHN